MEIIVTDLTRFKNESIVCIAGIEKNTKKCIRPMPYIEISTCRKLNILPGAILSGEFARVIDSTKPHVEDCNYSNLYFCGPCTAEDFRFILESTLSHSLESGFECGSLGGQKYISCNCPPQRSLITLKVKPTDISVVQDKFNPEKLRAIFTDKSGITYWYLSITDLGFYEYAERNNTDDGRKKINRFLRNQEEVFLRIGLSRQYKTDDGRKGFWIQVNGIYTFPDYLADIRSHR